MTAAPGELLCDALIVGGGPAGLIAARELARALPSADILLIERDRAIGAPVRCGEGVGSKGLEDFISPAGARWISRRITKVVFWAPDGTEVRVAEGDVGYVLDRTLFEPALAAEAGREGVEIRVGTEATGMQRVGDRWAVHLQGPHGAQTVRARLVVGADGVESMVGRWAGLDTRVPARDMESCAQYVLAGIEFDPDAIYLHFGSRIAPGGYAWVFPKDVGVANVGLGVVALRSDGRTAQEYLDRYVADYFPTGVRTGRTVGGVIVHPTLKQIVADGVMLCGDAAHMINPLSGGGIVNAMKAGRLLAQTAAAALCAGDVGENRLRQYHTAWMSLLGDDHVRFYRLKDMLGKFDDAFYNSLARTVNRIPQQKRSLRRIFASALARHPALFPVIAKYFA
ncbi:MAG: NAD(P)/FAD-dependent oxidoreductase [Gemmatimonadaceae bacterium]